MVDTVDRLREIAEQYFDGWPERGELGAAADELARHREYVRIAYERLNTFDREKNWQNPLG